jgi:2-oxoglutarate dehydrogenase complex dehydrogenase (E1) component-like enzyme
MPTTRACLAVVRLAMMYREKFHGDVVIDLIGYRRYGHNEGDEPAYTQPVLYRRSPSTRPCAAVGRSLAADGVMTRGGVEDLAAARTTGSSAEQAQVKTAARRCAKASRAEEEAAKAETSIRRAGGPARFDSTARSTLARRLQGQPQAEAAAREARPQRRRRRRRASTGPTPRRSHSLRCSPTACPSG